MYALLFDDPVVDRQALRFHANQEVATSPLIRECGAGQLSATRALLQGFWPFVQAFEKAIDVRVSQLPIRPLIRRFGRARIKRFMEEARAVLREMKEEEGSHTELWRQSALQVGADLGVAGVTSVQALLNNLETGDLVEFFCWLAGTEYIAESLAEYLCNAPPFLALFPESRWIWGEVHTAEHQGPSHLEIDEDFARAYYSAEDPGSAGAVISSHIRRCQSMFGTAAEEIMLGHPAVASSS